MATVAEQLRQAREANHLTVDQVADTTKMKRDYVRALEEGNYDAFVAPVYIRGFARTYAILLKVNVPDLMRDLEAELGKTAKFSEPPSLTNQTPSKLDRAMLLLSRINWRIAGPVGTIIVLALLGVWGAHYWQDRQSRDPLAGVGPGLYKPAQKPVGETLPLTAPPKR